MVAAVSRAYFVRHILFILKHCTLMLLICQPDTGDKDSGNSAIPQTSVNKEMARFVSALCPCGYTCVMCLSLLYNCMGNLVFLIHSKVLF